MAVLLFFFSSRRRHTRSLCDWSSDVCSSDLGAWSPWPWQWTPRSRTRPCRSTTSPRSSRSPRRTRMGRWLPRWAPSSTTWTSTRATPTGASQTASWPAGCGPTPPASSPPTWPPAAAAGRPPVSTRRPRRARRPQSTNGGGSTPSRSWPARLPAAVANWPECWSGWPARPAGWRTPPPWSASAAPWAGPAPSSMTCSAILSERRPSGRTAVNADRPDPGRNGAGGVRTDGHTPAAGPADPERRLAGRVSRLDRVTLQLGVAVAVVIALCSYAVSATSLYALGVQAGYSWWQAAAVPVVADGPAIYGMFRIVSGSRRGAKGAGYGWLLVTCGTAASIGGNVAHAHPNLVAQTIAAAIPLAVLAMLEGLKGDASEVTRLAAQAGIRDRRGALEPASQLPQAITVRRTDPTNLDPAAAVGTRRRALPAAHRSADHTTVGVRLQAAYAQSRPDGQPWTARTLAEAAGCGRSSAAAFLQRQRPPAEEHTT